MTPASSAIFILVVFFAALCTCLEDGDRRNPLSKDFCDNLYVSHALTFCRRWIVCEKVQLVSKTATTGNARSSKWIWKLANSQLLLRSFPVDTQKRNYIRTVPNAIFSFVSPTPFNTPVQLAAYSSAVLTNILDLDVPSILNLSAWLDIISGRSIIPGSKPIAHRYGGHQFGVWAGQLGDGRAVMLGEYVNRRDERWELQLKGSGKTPYSRQGDGRAVLRSSVREFLCSEAMHHLGIPTSRAASLVVSKDKILRDQFYNGNIKAEKCAIVLRLAKSWFRIGSLEVLSANEEFDLLRELVDFIIKHYFEDIDEQDPDKYLSFFSEVVNNTATLMAQWMSVGFAHGVMNTDNFSILSITIDYGPFGFLDAYNPKFVPNTSDDEERYSFEKQPDVGQFNLDKLRRAMIPLLTSRQESYIQYILDGYVEVYKSQYMKILRNKLGLNGNDGKDEYLVALLLKIMEDEKSDFTMTFRHLSEIQLTDLKQYDIKYEFWTLRDLIQSKYFKKWISLYAARLQGPGFDDSIRQTNMMNNNPRYVLRNWIAQMAIENAEKGNYSVIELVSRVLKEPFTQQADAEMAGFANRPPSWSKKLKVSCSS